MAIGFNIQFRINEKTASRVIRLTDTSTGFTLAKGNFSIVFPDGTTINHTDFQSPDITAGGQSYDYQASTDIYNNVLTGAYIVTFVALDNASGSYTKVQSFDFNWVKPSTNIQNKSDVFIPEVQFYDATSYLTIGNFTGTLTRTFSVPFPTTSEANAITPTSTSTTTLTPVYAGKYYEGLYNLSLDVTVNYTNSSYTYLSLYYTNLTTKTYDIRQVPTQTQLVTKLNAFRADVDIYKEKNDTQFEIMSENYDIAIALYSHLIARYQTGTLDGSQPLLEELLSILEPYNGIYSYKSTQLTPFVLGTSENSFFTLSDGTHTDNFPLQSTLLFSTGSAALNILVSDNTVTYTPSFGTANGTFAAGDDSRFHTPVTLGTANGLSLASQAISLGLATSGTAGAMSGADKAKLDGIASGATANLGTVTSVGISMPSAFSITNSPITGAGTLTIAGAGTSTQYIKGDGSLGTLNTAAVVESTGLYFTDSRARSAISLTTTGTSGAATYSSITGILNIPQYQGGVTSFNTRTGAVVLSSSDVTTALAYTPENAANKGIANGYASLDGSGLVLSSQLPSYVDDVLEYTNLAGFPVTGTTGKIYVALDTNKIYRWSGSTYIEIGTAGTGSVTSVGLSMPSAFTVTNSPVNSSGTLTVTGAGSTAQYINGLGQLVTFPSLLSSDKMLISVRNATGATLYKGTVVSISGSTGALPNVIKSQANAEATSAGTFGIIYADLPNNTDGQVLTLGSIDTLDTRSNATNPFTDVTLADGDTIYLHPTVAGYITNVKPSAPNHLVYVGKVTRTSPTNGTIVYRIQNGYELDEIHDVQVGSYVNKDILYRDTATNLWKNASIATVLGYTPLQNNQTITLSGAVTGSGTTAITTTLANSIVGTANLSATGTPSATTYLRGDNTWATITAGGGTVTTVSVTSANGFAGTVATATSTPAITISTTITGLLKGNGTSISAATAGTDYLTSVGIANLTATGTPSSTTYLRGDNTWATITAGGTGTVTSASVVTANGFAGSVANATTTPAITISTTITGLLKGNGTAISAATAGTDYQAALTGTGFVKSTAGTISYDTNTYLTANQSITLSGAVTGTGTTAIATTLANGVVGIANHSATGTASASTFLRGDNTWASIGAGGTVTTVSVVSANGFAGTVANATSTPAITISTSITGVLKGNGTAISAATAGTDFQAPITLTTTGTSGAATFTANTLNIPQYTSSSGTVTSVAALTLGTTGTDVSSTVANGTTAAVITLNIPTASASNRGALSSTDWSTFNGKQGALTLTTTGSSGAATLVGNTLNIPQYTGGGGGTVGTISRAVQNFTATASQATFTISGGYTAGYIDVFLNGVRLTAADYTATNGTTVVMAASLLAGDIVDVMVYNGIALSGTAPIVYNSTTGAISINQANTSTNGYLSSTDWNAFNSKQAALGYTPLNSSNPVYTGVLTTGTLTYSPAGHLFALQTSANTYSQTIIQNSNSGSTASADIVVNNDLSTDTTYYGDFGINSSGFAGSGSLNLANNVYLTATTADLAIGTTTSNAIHFVVGGSATDAMTIATTSQLKLPAYTTTSSFTGTAVGVLGFDSSGNIITIAAGGSGTVTSVSVTSANGFAGTVATASSTPAITISTSITGLLKGNGTSISAATAGTDYQAALTGTGFVKSTAGIISYDTNTYLTANQSITLSGVISGSGATAITTTLASSVVGISNLSATGTPSATTYLRGDNTWATVSGGSGSPAGTTGQVQYNNAGAFGGASYVSINTTGHLTLTDSATIPTTPSSGTIVFFAENHAGKTLPAVMSPTGIDYNLQAALYGNSTYMWLASTGTTVAIAWGTTFTALNAGTAAAQSHPTKASTSAITSMNRANFGTGSTTTGSSGIVSANTVAWLGNAAGLGGFLFFARFGVETLSGTHRVLVGLSANTAALAAEPSTLANTIALGYDSTDTTWQIITRSATTLTKTNTAITITAGQILDLYIHSAPNSGSVQFHIKNGATGADLYVGTSISTNLPATTQFLSMQAQISSLTGTTAKVLALNRMYLETDL